MNILVLMAGDGKRFKDAGCTIPKPLIDVKGKSILEHTLDSFPLVKQTPQENLYFAVRQEHQVDTFLYMTYGQDINIIEYKETTRGNLETAMLSSLMLDEQEPLLILDADNKYDGNSLKFDNFPENSMGIVTFDLNDKTDTKWAFAVSEKNKVSAIYEKDNSHGGNPMLGVFYFSSTKFFLFHAAFILQNNLMVRNEFYMSQVPSLCCANSGTVIAQQVTNVTPLGTPGEVGRYANSN